MCTACALRVHYGCTAGALRVHCGCTAGAPRVHRRCTAGALHGSCMCTRRSAAPSDRKSCKWAHLCTCCTADFSCSSSGAAASVKSRRRGSWPLAARGALALAHGGPLDSRAELRPFRPRSAAAKPPRAAVEDAGFHSVEAISSYRRRYLGPNRRSGAAVKGFVAVKGGTAVKSGAHRVPAECGLGRTAATTHAELLKAV